MRWHCCAGMFWFSCIFLLISNKRNDMCQKVTTPTRSSQWKKAITLHFGSDVLEGLCCADASYRFRKRYAAHRGNGKASVIFICDILFFTMSLLLKRFDGRHYSRLRRLMGMTLVIIMSFLCWPHPHHLLVIDPAIPKNTGATEFFFLLFCRRLCTTQNDANNNKWDANHLKSSG